MPRSPLKEELARIFRSVPAWMVATWGALAAVGLAVDTALLVAGGAGVRAALVCGLAAVALGGFVALAAALPAALVAALASRVGRARSRLRHAWTLAVAIVAWLFAAAVTAAPLRYHQGQNHVVMLGFAATIGATAVLARAQGALPRLAALATALVACAADVALVKSARDLHDLLAVVVVAASLAAARPLRRRLFAVRPSRLAIACVLGLLVAAGTTSAVDRAAPGWRVRAWQFDRYQGRLARACRVLVDLDIDGFSPVAWGGDCDDFDASRNPFAHERPGRVDANCNGVTPSESPTDDDRGLAPPAGDPAYPPGQVDLVLLVTFDCGRRDVIRPDVMPSLSKLAGEGVVFERLYAGGTRTNASLPLMQRTRSDAPPITSLLTAHGVATTAVFAWRDDVFTRSFLPNFAVVDRPDVHLTRWDAQNTTDHALVRLRAHSPNAPELLWVHYFDAHDPVVYAPPSPPHFARPTDLPPSYDAYLAAIAHVDAEMGRLFDELDRSGQRAHTVVIVTSDHGEGFGRHGVQFHSVSGYESVVHVPGVLVAPGLSPTRYPGLVSHRDLPATILGALGEEAAARDAEVFGRSWLRLRGAPGAPLHRFVVSRSARAAREAERLMPMGVIVEGDLKVVETFEDQLLEMYDLRADPTEDHDLVPSDPADLARLRHDLALYRDIDQWP